MIRNNTIITDKNDSTSNAFLAFSIVTSFFTNFYIFGSSWLFAAVLSDWHT
jgi:hypothetical protein